MPVNLVKLLQSFVASLTKYAKSQLSPLNSSSLSPQLRCEGNLYIVSEANNVLLDNNNYYMFSMNDLCRANFQICKFTIIINIYIFPFSLPIKLKSFKKTQLESIILK